jgi:hypothetical protein
MGDENGVGEPCRRHSRISGAIFAQIFFSTFGAAQATRARRLLGGSDACRRARARRRERDLVVGAQCVDRRRAPLAHVVVLAERAASIAQNPPLLLEKTRD